MRSRDLTTPAQTPAAQAVSTTCDIDSQTFNCLTGKKMSGFKSSRRHRRFVPYTREVPEDSKCLYTSLYKTNSDRTDGSKNKKKKKETVQQNAWNELTNTRWKLHDVSPLHNFDSSAASLRFYSRQLSAAVAGMSRNIESIEETADRAEVRIADFTPSRGDGFAMEFRMHQKTGNTSLNQSSTARSAAAGSNHQVVLVAYLFSGLDPAAGTGPQNQGEGFTMAPLLFTRGPVRLVNVLLDWIKTRFDCCVTVHTFSSVHLCWLVAMFSGYLPEKSPKSVQLVYEVPAECSGLSTFTYDIKPQDCQRLWKSLHPDETDDRVTARQVMSFIMALENHFYYHFKIKLAAMKIIHIETPTFSINADGKVKIYLAGRAEQLLACIEQFSCLPAAAAATATAAADTES